MRDQITALLRNATSEVNAPLQPRPELGSSLTQSDNTNSENTLRIPELRPDQAQFIEAGRINQSNFSTIFTIPNPHPHPHPNPNLGSPETPQLTRTPFSRRQAPEIVEVAPSQQPDVPRPAVSQQPNADMSLVQSMSLETSQNQGMAIEAPNSPRQEAQPNPPVLETAGQPRVEDPASPEGRPTDNDMEIEAQPEPFNFGLYGLPNDFLEIAGIDLTFFQALPLEFQIDTVVSFATDLGMIQPGQARPAYRPINRRPSHDNPPSGGQAPGNSGSQQRQPDDSMSVEHQRMHNEQENNLLFIESLDTVMRAEILATCPDEFLRSLPENIQAEAQRLREQGFAEELEVDDSEPADNVNQFTLVNRIQQSIKKNKQKDLIKKFFGSKAADSKLYPSAEGFLDVIIRAIQDPVFQIHVMPISHLSSILLSVDRQAFFFHRLMELIEAGTPSTQHRALTVLETLSYSNFLYFHEKPNFDRLLRCLNRLQNEEQLLMKLTKALNHIVKTTLGQTETGETCDITITQENLESLMCILYSKNQALFEALIVILFMLSSNVKNLELIIDSLQENIAQFAFSLNIKFEDILRLDKSKMERSAYLALVASKISDKMSMQNGILKIFRLLEQLFKRSFSLKLSGDADEDESVSAEAGKAPAVKPRSGKDVDKSSRFNELKSKVLASFANYFKQTNIKMLFYNMFKVLNIYEPILNETVENRRLSKPVFMKLMPLIESFFIIYKLLCDEELLKSIKLNLQLKEISAEDVQIAGFNEMVDESDSESVAQQSPARHNAFSKDGGAEESGERMVVEMSKSKSRNFDYLDRLTIESLFLRGIRTNRNLFNYLLGQVPRISSSPFSVLVRHTPRYINFDIKRRFFQQTVQGLRTNLTLKLIISRNNIFHDSYTQMNKKSTAQMRGKLQIKFNNEEGIDAGGVQREWFNELGKEIFNPNYALFIPAAHGYAYQPSPFSTVNQEHLNYFRFIGKMFGRALLDGNLMDAHFTRSFYKHMTGTPLNYTDLEDYDQEYFRTIKWILENPVESLDLDFTYERENFGVKQMINLKPNGAKIPVTDQNKAEYVRLICEQKLTEEIRPQIKSFLEGLNSVIPAHLIKMFDPKELELMFSGMPEVDLQDLKDNTEYFGYTESSPIIQRFWEVMHEFDESMKAGFLQFVSGTSKVPVEGFSHLRGMGGIQRFNIHKAFDVTKLPTSHTCMNQLDLPNYETKAELKDKLTKAILYGKEGFGFA
jgi:E3 ubiquitin-protein ligase HUWE1